MKIEDLGPSVAQVAEKLDCHKEHVRRLIRRKQLRAQKVGKKYYVKKESLAEYLDSGDLAQKKLALRWLALVGDRSLAPAVARLMVETFGLGREDLRVVLTRWGAVGVEDILRKVVGDDG